MFDNCSKKHFITSAFCKKLKLCRKPTKVTITGLGQSKVAEVNSKVNLYFQSQYDNQIKYHIEALVVPDITGHQPARLIDTEGLEHLTQLQLADNEFHIPAPIDILIGAELYYQITTGTNSPLPTTIKSTLGWLVRGGRNPTNNTNQATFLTNQQIQENTSSLNSLLKKFWELESIPDANNFSSEEQQCEEYFSSTYSRDNNGRFIVRYPFKKNPEESL